MTKASRRKNTSSRVRKGLSAQCPNTQKLSLKDACADVSIVKKSKSKSLTNNTKPDNTNKNSTSKNITGFTCDRPDEAQQDANDLSTQKDELPDSIYFEIEREKAVVADKFEEYYRKVQKIPGAANNWDVFFKHMHHPLPLSFRFSSVPWVQKKIQEILKELKGEHEGNYGEDYNYFDKIALNDFRTVPGIKEYKFKNISAFQCGYDEKVVAKHPEIFRRFRSILVKYSRNPQLLIRQEIVSMFPVFLLDIKPHHRILDMCASPGSKTTQALEKVIVGTGSSSSSGSNSTKNRKSPGFVVANEIDFRRSHTLVHRCSTIDEIASAHCCVTRHKAQDFPVFDKIGRKIKFDRIICDVPCSGDGTMRKFEEKWRTWEEYTGRSLHSLQIQILLRAMRVLDVNGVVCYSTCSLNPFENESVVAAVLEIANNGKSVDSDDNDRTSKKKKATLPYFEIVDASEDLKFPFKTENSLTEWVVPVYDEEKKKYIEIKNHADLLKSTDNKNKDILNRQRIRQTMFPFFSSLNHRKQVAKGGVRMVPQHGNTGGFYSCLIRKVREWPEADNTRSSDEAAESVGSQDLTRVDEVPEPAKKKRKRDILFSDKPDSSTNISKDGISVFTAGETFSGNLPHVNAADYIFCEKAGDSQKEAKGEIDTDSKDKSKFIVVKGLHDILRHTKCNIVAAGKKLGPEYSGSE